VEENSLIHEVTKIFFFPATCDFVDDLWRIKLAPNLAMASAAL